jgi:tetratricopeptide (TPR) repeat protein
MALQSLVMPIVSLFRSAGITQARNALGGLNNDFGSLAGSIGKASGAFAAFQGLAGARAFVIESVEGAQRFERNMLALKQVFQDAAPALNSFTREVENYGLSQGQAAQASVFLGSVLKQYGFSVSEASAETQKLVTLSQDLATTYGYELQDALLSVTALFRGEYDPIEKFGVAMKQAEVSARVASKGLGELTLEQEANEMAIARLEMLYERAGDSIGAFGRASDTLYASQQRLNAVVANTQIAFGAELQAPLAAINNIFTEIAQQAAPELVEISKALGDVIENLGPTVEQVATGFVNLIALLQPTIELLGFLTNVITTVLNPALETLNGGLGLVVQFFDTWSATTATLNLQLERLGINLDGFDLPEWLDTIIGGIPGFGLLVQLSDLEDQLLRTEQASRAVSGEFATFTDGAKAATMSAWQTARVTRLAGKAAEDAAPAYSLFKKELQMLGVYSEDADKGLTGLALLFSEIQTEAEKSEASEELARIGFNAGQIAEILTRPDWVQIFGEISRLAKMTAIDIASIPPAARAYVRDTTQGVLDELVKGLKGDTGAGGTPAKDFVKEFFDGIQEEMKKQQARLRLAGMGASTGLIDSILGSEGWEKVFARVIANGVPGLKKLQTEWNRTAAGIEEANAKQKEFLDQQEKLAEQALEIAEAFIEARKKEADAAEEAYKTAKAAADDFLWSLADISTMRFIPDVEVELGRFESSIVDTADRIREKLSDAFRNEIIYKEDFDNITRWVATEETALRLIGKQRDDLAEKYTLSEAIINDYKRAFTSALSLTSLFDKISTKGEKITVDEVSRGVITLGKNLREFGITVTRSFEETVEKVTDKSGALLDGFREMATKARAFAANLRTLKQMGLDPMLFNQLVEAGVEAGGATAQALVDGGSDTITEINSLFKEISDLGAQLGAQTAKELYFAGEKMGDDLLAGIRSKQGELEATARALADSFNSAFTAKIIVDVAKPVEAARAASEVAAAAVPNIQAIDMAALAKIQGLIANAVAWSQKNLNFFEMERTAAVLDIYRGIEQDLLNARAVDVSGIRSGMSVSDLAATAAAGGATNVNNFYMTIQTDATQSNAIIGKTIDNVIKTYTRTGGGGGGGPLVAV